MNWPVILSMILILIVGIVTYRSGKPTESIVITLILLMIFYIVYGHYYYSTADGFEVKLTPEQEKIGLILNRLETNSTFMTDFQKLAKDAEDKKITVEKFADELYLLSKANADIISLYSMTVDNFFTGFLEFLINRISTSSDSEELEAAKKLQLYIDDFKKKNSVTTTSPTVTGLPIVTGTGTSNGTGANAAPEEIKLTFKQKTAKMIAEYMDNKTKREWMMRIMKRIQDTKPNMQNPDNNLPQIMYNASLPEKKLFDEVVKENNITGMTFDEFFIAMVEVLIESNKNPRSPMYAFISKFEPLFQAWRVKHLAATGPTGPTEKPAATEKAATPSVSESAPAPVTELAKLLEVLKPATATTINPTASASEIGTVVNTSPGLQQGAQYNTVMASRTFPTPGPRCPQPAPKPNCGCQKPIMPDGQPFDPNMYIRKDSIPCWNCQLPI